MTILVTGANGQLGNEMRIVSIGSTDRYIFTDVVDAQPESVSMLHKLVGNNAKDVSISSSVQHVKFRIGPIRSGSA